MEALFGLMGLFLETTFLIAFILYVVGAMYL